MVNFIIGCGEWLHFPQFSQTNVTSECMWNCHDETDRYWFLWLVSRWSLRLRSFSLIRLKSLKRVKDKCHRSVILSGKHHIHINFFPARYCNIMMKTQLSKGYIVWKLNPDEKGILWPSSLRQCKFVWLEFQNGICDRDEFTFNQFLTNI